MTRRDFELIASIIRESPLQANPKSQIALHFAKRLSEANPLFNTKKFLAAAYPEVYEGGA